MHLTVPMFLSLCDRNTEWGEMEKNNRKEESRLGREDNKEERKEKVKWVR